MRRIERWIARLAVAWWCHWLRCDIEQLILDGDEAGAIELRGELDRLERR